MRNRKNRALQLRSCFVGLLWLLSQGLYCQTAASGATDWPQEISAPEGTIVIYQPQPEKLEGDLLIGRAAMSLELKGREEPIFGVFWYEAHLDSDGSDTIVVLGIDVTRVTWPDSQAADEQRFSDLVEGAVEESGFEISRERLSASLATAEEEMRSLAQIKNDPPKIVFSDELAVLLLYDGQPRFSPIDNSPYERALNTSFLVVREKKSGNCYLSSGTLWYQSGDPGGPWSPTNSPPKDLVAMVPEPEADEPAPSTPPKVVVATEPTELIASDGQPTWETLPNGDLLYVVNTETPWLRELSTNEMYILLSGRWFRSKSQDGPWEFVRADKLPAGFQEIPPASDIGGLRTSVAGTDEALEAVQNAQIPETAAIKRSEAKLEVEYDGKPNFEKIEGTEVSYAVNTGAQVLAIEGRYYAVDNGVWFVADKATGPWVVADTVPDEKIAEIPPSSPAYNTTYVKIYQSTPEIVYVGYTPGYMWSYPYWGVPIYGTGWYYPPYYGRVYYPRPPTWGFHVGYNPWTGWNFGVSWSNGFFRFGASWGGGWHGGYRPWGCCGGWYGGGYHRGPTVINTGNINIGNTVNVGNRANISNRARQGTNASLADARANRSVYNRPETRTRNADRATAHKDLKMARPTSARANDVYADRSGNVAKRTGDGWQTRDKGEWKPSTLPEGLDAGQARDRAGQSRPPGTTPQRPQTMPQTRPQSRPQIDTRDLNRHYNARQTGRSREMRRPAGRGGRRR